MVFKHLPFPLACVPWSWLHEKTIEVLSRDTLEFISLLQWPPNSPDIKPVDYAIWWKLQLGMRLPQMNPWRRPPRWATRGGPRHQCCSCSVVSSSACVCEGRQRTFWTLFMTTDEWSHCFIGDNWTFSQYCHGNVFLTRNWKHVIKYDFYVNFFLQIFAHSVQMCAKFSCKDFTDVCPVL